MVRPSVLCRVAGLIVAVVGAHIHHRSDPNTSPSQGEVHIDFGPRDPFAYMVDNTYNTFGVAPDKGTQNGPVWLHSSSFAEYMTNLNSDDPSTKSDSAPNDTPDYIRNVLFDAAGSFFVNPSSDAAVTPVSDVQVNSTMSLRSGRNPSTVDLTSDYWLPALAALGSQPLAGSGYKVYRDVTAYGAKGDGIHDDTEAINAAIQDGHRCGKDCSSSFRHGAIVYFPPGTYRICRPIVQLYYTQFIGHPTNRPTIVGCEVFAGMALIDTDPYIPGGNGANWYLNQNQFFRQIRNFVLDMTRMPLKTDDAGQPFSPTGIHWQVSQACSLQNILFNMPTDNNGSNYVGILTENGSGGFVSDLEFHGGAIGWRAGTQQYTARNLKFRGCNTAVHMIWDWGFNFQEIDVDGGSVAFNISGKGGITGQGVGSVSFIDCKLSNVPVGILTDDGSDAPPNMVIDNLAANNVSAIVKTTGGDILLPGAATVGLWAIGQRYMGGTGTYQSGDVGGVPIRPASLLSNGSFFSKSRPQYETLTAGDFLVATTQGILNDGTGDQAAAINSFLQSAVTQKKVAFFPAGIYQVQQTVKVPVGSRIQGSSWSQIMGTGSFFSNLNAPQVMVQVGNPGDSGVLEIVEMLFTVKGATAGAILMEWNVHESEQGSASMWDSHFRVGGATGTNLTINDCPKLNPSGNCISATLLFHVTSNASGYFENNWAWTADHDGDMDMYNVADTTANQISVYTGRGMLIESQGPSWFVGSGSEHSALYQYQLYKAKDIYLGHMQTETPYYQPNTFTPAPLEGNRFPSDPTFEDCTTKTCHNAWALRIVESSSIYIHSAGAYSFFQNYNMTCVGTSECQERLIQVKGSKDVVIFNVFTLGAKEVASGANESFVPQNVTQSGFTTEVSVWVPLDGDDADDIVYAGTEIFTASTMQATAPCIIVLPSVSIATTTITLPAYTTSLQVGSGIGTITTLTLQPPPITTDSMSYSNVNVTVGQVPGQGFVPTPSMDVPPMTIAVTGPDGKSTSRTISFPPWPEMTDGPPRPESAGGSTSGWQGHGGPWLTTTSGANAATSTPFGTVPGPGTTISGPFPTRSWPSTTTPEPTWTGPWPSSPTSGLGFSVSWPTTTTPLAGTFTFGAGDTTDGSVLIPLATPYWMTITANSPTTTTLTFPSAVSPLTVECPSQSIYTFSTPDITVTFPCPLTTTINFLCPTTTTVFTLFAPTTTPFFIYCTHIIEIPIPPIPSTTSSSTTALPTWLRWPPGYIMPVTTDVEENKPEPTGGHGKTKCAFWFFFVCIKLPTIHIGGLKWILPPGIYPPGPPPPWLFHLPPGFEIKGKLPPWPRFTIGPDFLPTYPSNPDKPCETMVASICSTTTSFISFSTAGTMTTSTSSSSTCATIVGCDVEDSSTATQVSTCSATKTRGDQAATAMVTPAQANARVARDNLSPGADCQDPGPGNDYHGPAILYPVNPKDQAGMGRIKTELTQHDIEFYESRSGALGFTAFFWLDDVFGDQLEDLELMPEVQVVYYYQQWRANVAALTPMMEVDKFAPGDSSMRNESTIAKRSLQQTPFWELSQVSTPKHGDWMADPRIRTVNPATNQVNYNYFYHGSAGAGQYVYVVEDGIWGNHEEFEEAAIEHRPGGIYADDGHLQELTHGTKVVSKIVGKNLGVAKDATAVILDKKSTEMGSLHRNGETVVMEMYLESFLNAADDIVTKGRAGRAVVCVAWGEMEQSMPPEFWDMMHTLFQELDNLGAPIVVSSGNTGLTEDGISLYPARFLSDEDRSFPNLIVVGATNRNGRRGRFSNEADWMTTYAPGDQVVVADAGMGGFGGYKYDFGTSFAAPMVAGLIAYYRGLPLPEAQKTQLQNPRTVKALVTHFHRRLMINDPGMAVESWGRQGDSKPMIWNGQVFDHSCLLDRPFPGDAICGDMLPADLGSLSPSGGESVQGGGDGSDTPIPVGQIPPGGQSSQASGTAQTSGTAHISSGLTITFLSGTPSPTCTAECGRLCTGFYCDPDPTAVPPDFTDPINSPTLAATTSSLGPFTGPPALSSFLATVGGPTTVPSVVQPSSTRSCLSQGPVTTCAAAPDGQSACVTTTSCYSWTTASATTAGSTTSTSGSTKSPSSTTLQPTTTVPPTTTTEPPPPSPTPTKAYVAIVMTLYEISIGRVEAYTWEIFSDPLNVPIDFCNDRAIFKRPSNDYNPEKGKGFPDSIDAFETPQGDTCHYEGTKDKMGLLICEGVQNMWCEQPADRRVTAICGEQGDTRFTVVVLCRW